MKRQRIDLRVTKNQECLRCDRKARKDSVSDEICTTLRSSLDDLPVRCVGEWAYDKIYLLVQYFGIFAGGMKNKWNGLNYIEICSGPGRCVTRNDSNEMDGTALAVVNQSAFPELSQAVFVDIDPNVVAILNKRINALGAHHKARAFIGDYHDVHGLMKIIEQLHTNFLSLVFFDPTECDVPFATVETLTSYLKNADLIINIALGTDLNRNIVNVVLDPAFSQTKDKYERFLGIPDFLSRPDIVHAARLGKHGDLRKLFMNAYLEHLASIGYVHTNLRAVRHYYDLLFVSKSPKGLEFWMKANQIGPDNQRRLL